MRGRWASAAIGAGVARRRAGAAMDQQAQANEAQQQQAQRQIEAQQRQIEALQQQKQQQPQSQPQQEDITQKLQNMLTFTKEEYYLTRNSRNSRLTCYQRCNIQAAIRRTVTIFRV